MKKLPALMVTIMLLASAAADSTSNYQDWWWNPRLDGMGFNIGQQGDTVFVSWYLYDAASNASFLYLAGTLSDNFVSGTLWQSSGPEPGSGYDPTLVTNAAVGTASLTFHSANQATFSYDYDGLSGMIDLERFTFDQLDISGEWTAFEIGTNTGCTDPTLNGPEGGVTFYSISQNGSAITIFETYLDGFSCTYELTGKQKGSYIDAVGTFSCPFGLRGDVAFRQIRVIEDFLIFDYDLQFLTVETCRSQAKVSGIRDGLFGGN